MVLYELRGQNFDQSGYEVLEEMRAQSGICHLLCVPEEHNDMDNVWWAETGYPNSRVRDIGGYYTGL